MNPSQRAALRAPFIFRLAALLSAAALLLPGQRLLASGPQGAGNAAPVAHDDSLAAFTDQDFQRLYVLDNDTDPDFDPLIITNVDFAAHGDAAMDFYAVDYKPFPGFSGDDHFTYTISDGHGHTDTASVTVHVGASGTATTRFAVYATSKDGYDSSRWTVSPVGGATDPSGSGTCSNSAGLSIEDVLLSTPLNHYNAFDNGLTLWVDGNQVKPSDLMTVTHRSLLSGAVSVSGIQASLRYDGLLGSDTLRTLATFTNNSGVTKNITVTLATNVGSDTHTVIAGTSSGDSAFTNIDRWLVTSDSPTNPNEIVDTHVLFGPGAPPSPPSQVFTTAFVCNEDPIPVSYGVRARFNLTLNNGATKRLLFFNQAHTTNTAALTDAAAFFNANPQGLLGGLSSLELSQIVNWKLSAVSHLYLPLVKR